MMVGRMPTRQLFREAEKERGFYRELVWSCPHPVLKHACRLTMGSDETREALSLGVALTLAQ